MPIHFFKTLLRWAIVTQAAFCACSFLPEVSHPLITGLSGIERSISFQAEVIVDSLSSDQEIASAIAMQLKTAIGSLRREGISLSSREPRSALLPDTWQRTLLTTSPGGKTILKVKYRYDDVIIASKKLNETKSICFVVLSGDYNTHLAQ
jgi:hypothetical protein